LNFLGIIAICFSASNMEARQTPVQLASLPQVSLDHLLSETPNARVYQAIMQSDASTASQRKAVYVAAKVVYNPLFIEAALEEFKIAKSLSHTNVVKMLAMYANAL
jgi:hypothetical protein